MGYLAGLFLLLCGYWLGLAIAHLAQDSIPPMPTLCLTACVLCGVLAWVVAPRQKDG